MRSTTLAILASMVLAVPATAQHEGHTHASSPYAGQEDSGIAALSAEEIQQLRDGAGMGMARAAELNHYPGPKHVLEMAGELELSDKQRAAAEAAYDEMHTEAVRLGTEILSQEEQLQRRFAHGHIDQPTLLRATSAIARLYGELRFAHLNAHLTTAALLTAEQAELYDRLRGYR